jgi:hypothetical protein
MASRCEAVGEELPVGPAERPGQSEDGAECERDVSWASSAKKASSPPKLAMVATTNTRRMIAFQ